MSINVVKPLPNFQQNSRSANEKIIFSVQEPNSSQKLSLQLISFGKNQSITSTVKRAFLNSIGVLLLGLPLSLLGASAAFSSDVLSCEVLGLLSTTFLKSWVEKD